MHWHSATATTSLCRKAKCLAGFCSSELVHGSGLTWHNPKPNGKAWQLWAELVCSKQQGAGAAAQLPFWWWDRMGGCTAKKPGHRPWNDSAWQNTSIWPSWSAQSVSTARSCLPANNQLRQSQCSLSPASAVIARDSLVTFFQVSSFLCSSEDGREYCNASSHQSTHRARPFLHSAFIVCQGSCQFLCQLYLHPNSHESLNAFSPVLRVILIGLHLILLRHSLNCDLVTSLFKP